MGTRSSSDELGIKIIRALGLPARTKRFELVFEAGKPIAVKCESLVPDTGGDLESAAAEFAEYELRKREGY